MLESSLTIADVVRVLRNIKFYSRKSCTNLYETVQRAFEDANKSKKKHTTRHPTSRTQRSVKICREMLKKTNGTRERPIRGIKRAYKVDYSINISWGLVRTILNQDLNEKFVRCRRSQRSSAEHKAARVIYAKHLRTKYGVLSTSKNYKWDRIINTDFSAPFRSRRKINPQNDGIWIDKNADMYIKEVKINVNEGFGNCNAGLLLVGGICAEGLLPRSGPVFFTEWLNRKCTEIGKNRKTLDNKLYAMFIKQEFVLTFEDDLEEACEEYIQQDDRDKKH